MPFAQLSRVRLHYTLDGNDAAQAAQKPVLMLSNSLGTSGAMWDPQMEQWATHFRVLRYDTRGHGRSEVTPGPYSIAQLGQDVVELLDHLHLDRVHFLGLSMGGLTGLWLGLHAPQRLHRLVLSNTAAFIGPSDAWTTRASKVASDGLASIAAAVVSRWLTPEYAHEHSQTVDTLLGILQATPDAGYAANCIAVRDADFRTQLPDIQVPTLVMSGTGDLPTPPADGRFLAEHIAHAQYVELPGAHLANQEAGAIYAETVTRFLQS